MTFAQMEALSDDEWIEHMRPLAAILDFENPDND